MATEDRLIDAKALQRTICGVKCGCEPEDCGSEGVCVFNYFISNAPTVKAVEVVHGQWRPCGFGKAIKCSICGCELRDGWPYKHCPDCGARMDLED